MSEQTPVNSIGSNSIQGIQPEGYQQLFAVHSRGVLYLMWTVTLSTNAFEVQKLRIKGGRDLWISTVQLEAQYETTLTKLQADTSLSTTHLQEK